MICLYHSHVTTQPFADGGPARRGPTARARTGTWPITVQGPQHTWTAGRPRYTRAFKGLGAGLAKHSPELNPLLHTTGRRAGQIHPGTHAASAPARPLTVPAYHEAHTGRRAGGISQGIQVATDPAQPCPAHTHHPWDGGPAREAFGRYRPGHGTSQRHQLTHSGRPGRDKPAEAAGRTCSQRGPTRHTGTDPRVAGSEQLGQARKRAGSHGSRQRCQER